MRLFFVARFFEFNLLLNPEKYLLGNATLVFSGDGTKPLVERLVHDY